MSLPIAPIIDFFLTVLEKDNDDNAELAIKSINEMQKFYRNTFFVLSEIPTGPDRFFKVFKGLIMSLKDRMEEAKQPLEKVQA